MGNHDVMIGQKEWKIIHTISYNTIDQGEKNTRKVNQWQGTSLSSASKCLSCNQFHQSFSSISLKQKEKIPFYMKCNNGLFTIVSLNLGLPLWDCQSIVKHLVYINQFFFTQQTKWKVFDNEILMKYSTHRNNTEK